MKCRLAVFEDVVIGRYSLSDSVLSERRPVECGGEIKPVFDTQYLNDSPVGSQCAGYYCTKCGNKYEILPDEINAAVNEALDKLKDNHE